MDPMANLKMPHWIGNEHGWPAASQRTGQRSSGVCSGARSRRAGGGRAVLAARPVVFAESMAARLALSPLRVAGDTEMWRLWDAICPQLLLV
ncbi:hypothetical protein COCOBI_15-1700 [Coccomyxa sp. Obi]|nr:hypothetical protein COCOBI_15-1700 [Coccomyxa sp. Obi]